MKRKTFKLIVSFILIMVVSCDEPETVVTNYVHPDGSVTRKIEMKNVENKFELSNLQVPFDSTWIVRDSMEINNEGDTTWIKMAEKLFANADEINLTYKNDSGANKEISRLSAFKRRFKWFTTEYRFSENIDKKLTYGYPASDFLNGEELLFFYSPDNMKDAMKNGQDSLKYRALSDSVDSNTETWTYKNLVSEWIGVFANLVEARGANDFSKESLKAREDEMAGLVKANNEKFDSLWNNGILLREFIGEANALKYKTEADSSIKIIENNFFVNFKNYSVRIVMPGKVIGTNGFIDSSEVLLWPVKSDYFLTEPYEMWAESKTTNTWAWIVSGIFLIFVLTGVIIRVIKKG
jgi:hypothetical protein